MGSYTECLQGVVVHVSIGANGAETMFDTSTAVPWNAKSADRMEGHSIRLTQFADD